jgi:hypothetical protein
MYTDMPQCERGASPDFTQIPCKWGGIRLRRDTWVSVRYAEELHSAKSSVTLQSTDRHGILGQMSSDFQVPV